MDCAVSSNQSQIAGLPILELGRLLESLKDIGSKVIVNIGTAGESFQFAHIVSSTGEFITAHPFMSAYLAASAVTFAFPGVVTSQLLGVLGFSPIGPVAGTTAATWHGTMGLAKAASPFAYFQSAAMGGYGAPMMNGILRATSLGSSTFAAFWRSQKVNVGKYAGKSKIKAKL